MFGAMTRKPLTCGLALAIVLGLVLGSPLSVGGQKAGGDAEPVYEDSGSYQSNEAGGDAAVVFEALPAELSEGSEPAGSAEKAGLV